MQYEVEMKFAVSEMTALEAALAELKAEISPPQLEVDVYFAHPARDFAHTDEALRIRRKGAKSFVTYKGPKIDRTTKTRAEIDLPLPPNPESAGAFAELLQTLGFTPVGEVRKQRRKALIPWQDRRVEGSLDEVEGLGTFAELELIAEAEAVEEAKACIASLAKKLRLGPGERRSYLELLLKR